MSGLRHVFSPAGWREKLLWTATGASWGTLVTLVLDDAPMRDLVLPFAAAVSLLQVTLQVRLVVRRVDRIFRAEREADRRWLMRQRGRATGPQAACRLVPAEDRTLP